MKRAVIFLLAGATILVCLLIGAVLVIPRFIDLEQYKPYVERLLTEKTGLPVHFDGEISLSMFPRVAIKLSELRVASPTDPNEVLATVGRFDLRLKTLPLLSKRVEVSTFHIIKPTLHLTKRADGSWNWEKTGTPPIATAPSAPTPSDTPAAASPEAGENQPAAGFRLNAVQIKEFSLRNGSISLHDQMTDTNKSVTGIFLNLANVSLGRPIPVSFDAKVDGQPIRLTGSVGPVSTSPDAPPLPIDLRLNAFDTLAVKINGSITDFLTEPKYQVTVTVEPFNAKVLVSKFNPQQPLATTDPKALQAIGFHGTVNGTGKLMNISGGMITIDDTTVALTRLAVDLPERGIDLEASVDRIDIDRYLPPPANNRSADQSADQSPPPPAAAPTAEPATTDTTGQNIGGTSTVSQAVHGTKYQVFDYQPFRTIQVGVSISIQELRIHNGTINAVSLNLSGSDGLYTINPLTAGLYQGKLSITGNVDVRREHPAAALTIDVRDVQAGPLLRDFAEKDIIEGRLTADARISAAGDRPEAIKSSLGGPVNLYFRDGAIIGLDLAQLSRTIASGFSIEDQGERPATDFAELNVPITLSGGLAAISEATLKSPFIRALCSGSVNLVTEALDLRVEPRLVATSKGQGDEEQHSGVSIPVLVAGTWSSPTFSPDLEALARQKLPDRQEVEAILKSGTVSPERRERLSKEVEKAKGLLKGLLGR